MSKGDPEQIPTSEQKDQPSVGPKAAGKVEESAEPGDVQALQQELERHKERSKYHLEQWKRTAADLENYRKRVEKERTEMLKLGQAALMAGLLPVLDDLERAFQTLPAGLSDFTWTGGLALIERKLDLILQQHGLKEIEALGKPFDPAAHQSVLHEETTAYPDGQVMAVLQKGYMLHDKVLRPAMVKIARNKPSDHPSPQPSQTEASPQQAEADRGSAADEQPDAK